MLDYSDQGIMAFDKSGVCAPQFSKACLTLLEMSPAGKSIIEILQLDAGAQEQFLSLYSLIFDPNYKDSFDELMVMAPKVLMHPNGSTIQLSYKAAFSAEGAVDQVYVIVTDITERVKAEIVAEALKDEIEFLDSSLNQRQFFGAYMRHVVDFSNSLLSSEGPLNIDDTLREAHTLKGGAGLFKAKPLVNAFHDLEMELKRYRKPDHVKSIDSALLQKNAVNLETETTKILAMFKNRFAMDALQLEYDGEFSKKAVFEFADYLIQYGHHELWREYTQRVCAQSLFAYLRHYNMHLLDLADRLNKSVEPLKISGQDIFLHLSPYRPLLESFVHIFRNIMDHGIETSRDRKAAGKSEAGHVEINVTSVDQNGASCLRIEISDDGCGINCDLVRAKLIAKFPLEYWEDRPDEEVLNSVLFRHLSTRESVTTYSGQGVGMGAVSHEVMKLGGKIYIRSSRHLGTTLVIEVPFILEELAWDDRFAIQKDIDEDHKNLFGLFNSLSLVLSQGGDQSNILTVMQELAEYAARHFSREENLMKEIHYPGLLAHKEQHAAFVVKVKSVRDKYLLGASNSDAIETLEFVKDWLVNHIQKVDRAYAPYIKNQSINLDVLEQG